MTFEQAFTKSRERLMQLDPGLITGKLAIQVNLTGEAQGVFYIEVRDGELAVEPYDYWDRDVLFTVSGEDFLKILNKEQDAVQAFFSGVLHVEGDVGKALELTNLL